VLAGATLGSAVLLRLILDPLMGDSLALVTLFGAVAIAVWLGGYRPAVVVIVLGYVACAYLFIEPRGRLGLDVPANVVGLAAYLFTCTLIVGFGEATRRAQALANEQHELLHVTLASIGDAVITTDIHGRVTYLNAVAESVTGWTQRAAAGRPLDVVFRIVNEDTRLPVENPATKVLRDGIVVGLANHTVLIRQDGSECPIDDSAAPITNDRGHVAGCVLIFRDVSRQRSIEKDEAARLLTARLLAAIVESSNDAIIGKSLDGIIQSWNAAAERLFGYTADEAVGRHISLVIPPERIAEEDRIVASLRAGERIEHFETERLRSDGQLVLVSLTISPLKDDAGTVIGASKIVRDVTRQRQAEADRAKFVTLVENSTDFIGICDLGGVPLFVNHAGLAMVGLESLDDARRVSVASFFFPEDQPRIIKEFLPSVLEHGHGEIEVRFRHFKTGDALWMAYTVLSLPDAMGRPIAFATVSQDVTERKRLENNLRRVAEDLSHADQRKNEFLAMLAHELRTPLAPISHAARALRMGGSDEGTVRKVSDMLERQMGQMARLVDDLLDMSRITRGRIELRKEGIELAPIVHQAVEAARPLFSRLNHELTVTVPSEPVYLDADPTRLAQVIGNLLNNAGKFTDLGGHVHLVVEPGDGFVRIRVRDNGIGIAADQIPHLFEMFAQADTSLERSRDGVGIGLTLVKALVELHGGVVEAHSDGLGRGSEFAVRLPTATVASAPASLPTDSEVPGPVKGRRILIVDDSEDGAEFLALLLQVSGHETRQAHDGPAAIEAAEQFRPDAVLLDIGLPRMNGYEVCRRIREQAWGRDLVLIALTGWGQEEDLRRSREAGFDAHMVKPVDHQALMELLASLPERGNAAAR
jgi:PAS domain S-box-containing protein